MLTAIGGLYEPSCLLLQVRDKFYLELSEEEAIRVLQNLIDDSVNAIFAVLLERAHKMAQVSALICLRFIPCMYDMQQWITFVFPCFL